MSDNKFSHGRANDVIKMMKDREVKLHDLRRLYAVNQELLNTLNDVIQEAEFYVDYGFDRTDESANLCLAIARARATVAKAEEVKP